MGDDEQQLRLAIAKGAIAALDNPNLTAKGRRDMIEMAYHLVAQWLKVDAGEEPTYWRELATRAERLWMRGDEGGRDGRSQPPAVPAAGNPDEP